MYPSQHVFPSFNLFMSTGKDGTTIDNEDRKDF